MTGHRVREGVERALAILVKAKAVREHHKNNKTKTTNGRAARDMTDVYATIVERE